MAKRVIISGGGTGGHIFPAIAIANALRRIEPDIELLFVGANGKMEMEKVPAAGYVIKGLDIQGIDRKSVWKNLMLPLKLYRSMQRAKQIVREFNPDVAVGVGGYASGPLLYTAAKMNIPCLIQEQNSYAGITNKKLGAKAARICVAFDGMERFFPAAKMRFTGNPLRRESVSIRGKRDEALASFGLDPHKKTILVTGGSLGARTLNECMLGGLDRLLASHVQLIWQCGGYYYEAIRPIIGANHTVGITLTAFLNRMDLAYAAADIIIARAGAGTIAELCAVGKPAILVPSPNVAEDHQTKNARALVGKQAAVMIADAEAPVRLISCALDLLQDEKQCTALAENIAGMAILDADEVIAKEVLQLAGDRDVCRKGIKR